MLTPENIQHLNDTFMKEITSKIRYRQTHLCTVSLNTGVRSDIDSYFAQLPFKCEYTVHDSTSSDSESMVVVIKDNDMTFEFNLRDTSIIRALQTKTKNHMSMYDNIESLGEPFFEFMTSKLQQYIGTPITEKLSEKIKFEIDLYFSQLEFKCKHDVCILFPQPPVYSEELVILVHVFTDDKCSGLVFRISIDRGYIRTSVSEPERVRPIRIPDINQLDVTFKILSESEIKKFVRDIVITLMYNKYDASLIFDKAISACLNIDNQEDVPQRVKEEISNKLSDESMYVFISSVFMFTETWNAGPLVVENFETESVQKIEQSFKKRLSEFIKNGEILFNVSSYFDGTNLIISDITVTENPQKNNQHIYSYRVTVGKEPHNFSFKKSN